MEHSQKDRRHTSALPVNPYPSVPHCEEEIQTFQAPIQVLVGLTVLRAALRVAQQSPPVQQISNVNFDALLTYITILLLLYIAVLMYIDVYWCILMYIDVY